MQATPPTTPECTPLPKLLKKTSSSGLKPFIKKTFSEYQSLSSSNSSQSVKSEMIISRLLRGDDTPVIRTNFLHKNGAYVTPVKALRSDIENSAGRS
jgi:hypothetical protein